VFISFEGIDGSGKSTQLNLLREWLEQRGKSVVTIREPGATLLSESIREILLSTKQSITPTAELLLFSAARTQLVERVIEPTLAAGSIILCDRYVDSTTAYQGYGRGLNMDHVAQISQIATRGVMPELTFFIDVRYEQAQQRMQFAEGAAEPDRMERAGSEFFNRVRDGYLTIATAEPKRVVVIDGYRERDVIHQDILSVVEQRLQAP